MNLSTLVRPHILALSPYSSARDEYTGKDGVFLDANENPYGAANDKPFNRYPDPYQHELKTKIAKIKKVDLDQIFLGNGSDEPIDLLIKLFCEPKEDNMVIMPPTYGMYKVCADIQQIYIQEAPLTEDFQIDLDNVFDAVNGATKLIWICSPNNPSGNNLSVFAIEQILKSFPEKIVVIDEAYIDFSDQASFSLRLNEFENLVVLQTFSKAWGLAGLRLGMAFASKEIIKLLNKIKYPYNINLLTQQEAIKVLDFESRKNETVKKLNGNKSVLMSELNNLSIVEKIFPSDSNMILVKFKNSNEVFQYLMNQKIILRDRSKVALCEGCIRVSVGTSDENKTLLKALLEYTDL